MLVGRTNRLTQLEVLQGIGRDLLNQFLAFFQADLAAKNIPLPDPQSPGDTYFAAVASLFASTLNFKPQTQNFPPVPIPSPGGEGQGEGGISPTLDFRPKTLDFSLPCLIEA